MKPADNSKQKNPSNEEKLEQTQEIHHHLLKKIAALCEEAKGELQAINNQGGKNE